MDEYTLITRMDKLQSKIDIAIEKTLGVDEMNDIMFEMAQIGADGRKFEKSSYDMVNTSLPESQFDERIIKYRKLKKSFYEMMKSRVEKFGENSVLREYFEDAQQRMGTLNSLGNKDLAKIYSTACKITNHVEHQTKNSEEGNSLYNDTTEYKNLLSDYEDYIKTHTSSQNTDALKPLIDHIYQFYVKTSEPMEKGNYTNNLIARMDIVQKKINLALNENPHYEPDASEMNDIMFRVAQIGADGRKFEKSSYDMVNTSLPENQLDERILKYRKLRESFYEDLMEPRVKQFAKNSVLREYFEEAQQRMGILNSLGDKDLAKIYSSACGINNFIEQQMRDMGDDDILYNNTTEFFELLDSRTNYLNTHTSNQNTDALEPLINRIKQVIGKTRGEIRRADKMKEKDDPSAPSL